MTICSRALTWMVINLLVPISAGAYEVRTHEHLTRRAFERSAGTALYLQDVGIKASDVFDLAARTPPDRLAGFLNTGTALDWMAEGAIREDDFVDRPFLAPFGCRRAGNPPSFIDRPRHHFLDVQRDGRGLTLGWTTQGFPASDWALGRQGRGSGLEENQFSLPDARGHQFLSLTAGTPEERDRSTARLFRTLGHVIHLVEDMAQPQHTRNDPHAGCLAVVAGGESWYEHYVETRTLGEPFRSRGEISPPPVFDGYAPVAHRPYRAIFSDDDRRGLADFSSRNFFTAGTNLSLLFGHCDGLKEPLCDRSAYTRENRSFTIRTVEGNSVTGVVTLYLRNIVDHSNGTEIHDVPVSSRSVWDEHLERRGLLPKFSLNTINYDAMADLLLPRAVGYAAGLLDWFFRLRLEAQLLPPNSESSSGRIRVRAARAVDGGPSESLHGTFAVYYDAPDGQRVQLTIWENQSLSLGASLDLNLADLSADPPPSEPGRYLLVFSGQLGDEDDVISGTWVDGRLWYLTLRAESYDADFTLTGPVGSFTYTKGPRFSQSVNEVSAQYGEAGYEFPVHVAWQYSRAQIHLYECIDAFVLAHLLGEVRYGDVATYTAVYRASGVPWGTARVRLTGYGMGLTEATTPVTVEVVRFKPPQSLDELGAYTYSNPPIVEAVLGTFVVNSLESVDLGTIDLGDSKFIGIRVTPLPEYPDFVPDASLYGPLDYRCFQDLLRYNAINYVTATSGWHTSVGQLQLGIIVDP